VDWIDLPNKSGKDKKDKMDRDVAYMGGKGRVYRFLVGKSEGRRPLGRPEHKREDNI
jgi:hypothetical protein